MNGKSWVRWIFSFSQRIIEWRKIILVLVGIAIWGFTQLSFVKSSYFFQLAQAKLIDFRYRLRPVQSPNSNIVLVGITPSSLDLSAFPPEEIKKSQVLSLMQRPYPWDRSVYTAVLQKLVDAGASVVVFDLVFLGNTPGDKSFADLIEFYEDRVVLGAKFELRFSDTDAQSLIYVTPETILNRSDLSVVGFVNVWPELAVDNVIRRGRYRTSLLREFGREDDTEDLVALSALGVKKFLGKLVTPDYYESNFINFLGPPFTFPIYPIEHLFSEKVWKEAPYHSGQLFKNKIVIVGPADEIFKDQHMTPLGSMLGLELQANLTSTLLTNSSLREWPYWSDGLLTLGVIILAVLIEVMIGAVLLKVGFWSLCGVIITGVAWVLFVKNGVVMPLLSPLLGLAGISGVSLVLDFVAEQWESARVSRVLNRYVAPNVVKLILNERETFLSSLKGTKRAVTVLFSDLRNFTSLTEGAESEILVSQLNDYFSEMVEIVLKKGGTLHKFIGDSLMAVWGDTHSRSLDVDACSGVEAALEMVEALKNLNQRWQQEGKPVLQMGVGIDHGVVVVGNVGHPERMEFTVLGNAVNTASRIEGETKRYQVSILVSEEVYRLTQNLFHYQWVDEVQLRGKAKVLKLYQPLRQKTEV